MKEVARQFNSLVRMGHSQSSVSSQAQQQVHVDRYKKAIYDAVQSDPFLSSCTTVDASASRFHACERRAKCSECRTFDKTGQRIWNTTKRIVHVNMVEIKTASWDVDRREFSARLGRAAAGEGDWPFNIVSLPNLLKVKLTSRIVPLHDTVLYQNCKRWSRCSGPMPFPPTP